MSDIQIVTVPNLGTDFELNATEKRIHLKVDGDTLVRELDGTVKADLAPSADAGNLITEGTDGRVFIDDAVIKDHETVTNLTWDNATKVVTYENEAGDLQTIDLSQFVVDIHVSGASFNPSTLILTLTQSDGGADITVDLGKLSESSVTASTSVTLSGVGSVANPLKADLIVDPSAANLLTVGTAGALVNSATVFDLHMVDAFSTHVGWARTGTAVAP